MRLFLTLIFLLFYNCTLPAQMVSAATTENADEAFSDYETPVEVPEPLFIDLVRGLHSKKGEWEMNTLIYQTHTPTLNQLRWAPEVEWVYGKRSAIEFELPMNGNDIASYKVAWQTRTYQSQDQATLHGVQLIHEVSRDFETHKSTGYFILAHRFNYYYSFVSLLGARYKNHKDEDLTGLFNISFFYNYSDEVDLGLELNSSFPETEDQIRQIFPQLHLALRNGFKIQFGFGAQENEGQWRPLSTFRLIKEFNKKH